MMRPIAILIATLIATPALAGSNVYVGTPVKAEKTIPIAQIEHGTWGDLLGKYVDDAGQVDYTRWHASTADRTALRGYLRTLSRADLRTKSDARVRLAFWINAYNAVTVEGILREFPTTSIRNHTAKLWGYNIWDDLQLYVGETAYSLNQIEHGILRKMGEPRIHFAIVCASKGCPRLFNEAYVPDQVDVQLDANARHFFAQHRNFHIRGNRVTLSSILDWFGEDFGDSESAILRRIGNWLPDDKRKRLATIRPTVAFADYDWSLNGK